jgi:hypothetical protein
LHNGKQDYSPVQIKTTNTIKKNGAAIYFEKEKKEELKKEENNKSEGWFEG